MGRLNARQWGLFLLLLAIPAAFQNCGNGGFLRMQDMTLNEVTSLDPFFEYPYKTKPDEFVSIQLVGDPQVSKFSSFTLFVSAVPAEGGSEAVSYELKVMDSLRASACPNRSGEFSSVARSIEFGCAPAVPPSNLIVELTLYPATATPKVWTWTF